MSSVTKNPFEEPTADDPFSYPSVQQLTKKPSSIETTLEDFAPQQKSDVRGAANPPQYAPGAGPAAIASSSQNLSAVDPPTCSKFSRKIVPAPLTTSELQTIVTMPDTIPYWVYLNEKKSWDDERRSLVKKMLDLQGEASLLEAKMELSPNSLLRYRVIVRNEIERYDQIYYDMKPNFFLKDKIKEKLDFNAYKEEKRRLRWLHLLQCCPDQEIHLIRSRLTLEGVNPEIFALNIARAYSIISSQIHEICYSPEMREEKSENLSENKWAAYSIDVLMSFVVIDVGKMIPWTFDPKKESSPLKVNDVKDAATVPVNSYYLAECLVSGDIDYPSKSDDPAKEFRKKRRQNFEAAENSDASERKKSRP